MLTKPKWQALARVFMAEHSCDGDGGAQLLACTIDDLAAFAAEVERQVRAEKPVCHGSCNPHTAD